MSSDDHPAGTDLRLSPLAGEHVRLEARMAPFAGWEMPIQYAGIVAEHRAVRESAGVFDISHMGQFHVRGERSMEWLNGLLTNDLADLEISQGHYTLMLNEKAGVIDDLIIYRSGEIDFFLVVNASKIGEDLDWLQEHACEGVEIENVSSEFGAIAVQGPESADLWEKARGEFGDLPPRNGIALFNEGGDSLILCRTGYTGEDGFELFAAPGRTGAWFRAFLDAGATPCGLGARDTLRLEKCYPLNGADLDPAHTPLEAGLGFFVKLDKEISFIGQTILRRQKEKGLENRLVAIRQTGKGPPPREGYALFEPGGENAVATLTSGSLSPTLGTGIALAYLPSQLAKPGSSLEIEIRERRFAAEVVKKPFV